MADQSNQFEGDLPGDDRSCSAELTAEVCGLVDDLLEQRITSADLQRLEDLVVNQPAVAALYYKTVFLWCSLPLHFAVPELHFASDLLDSDFEHKGMDESMILPALREPDSNAEDEPPHLLTGPAAPGSSLPKRTARLRWWLGGSAALLLLCIGLRYSLRSEQPEIPSIAAKPNAVAPTPVAADPVIMTATAAAECSGIPAIHAGSTLKADQVLQLTRGAIELTFPDGAVVVVRAPARLHVIDKNAVALERGTLTAHVPPSARGFRVASPGLSVVDFGTNFGVRTADDLGAAEVHVFDGVIEAAATDASGRQVALPVSVIAGHAVSHVITSNEGPTTIVYKSETFERDIARTRLPVPLHGTGAQLPPGSPDPFWQIVSVPNDPNWGPRQAVVLRNPPTSYTPNRPQAKWIALQESAQNAAGGNYVFKTSVDLSELDPATMSVVAQVTADDRVADILVNGVSTGITATADVFSQHAVSLQNVKWRSGINQIDVVVFNTPGAPSDLNLMGLQLSWEATAIAEVRR